MPTATDSSIVLWSHRERIAAAGSAGGAKPAALAGEGDVVDREFPVLLGLVDALEKPPLLLFFDTLRKNLIGRVPFATR